MRDDLSLEDVKLLVNSPSNQGVNIKYGTVKNVNIDASVDVLIDGDSLITKYVKTTVGVQEDDRVVMVLQRRLLTIIGALKERDDDQIYSIVKVKSLPSSGNANTIYLVEA